MKKYIIYECTKCGKQSKDIIEIIKCEANHLGLTINEYKQYIELIKKVENASYVVSIRKNENTDKLFDNAIKALLEFEQKYNIEGD